MNDAGGIEMTIQDAVKRIVDYERMNGKKPEALEVSSSEAKGLAQDWLGTIRPEYSQEARIAVGEFLAGKPTTTIMGVPVSIVEGG